jgi:hypothetical protein
MDNKLSFEEWWEQLQKEVYADIDPKELARDAFEAGSSYCYYNINR